MIITHHGDVMYFICESCSCCFQEAVSKTNLEHTGVWDSEKKQHGTWMKCPDCGEDVLGFRKGKHEREND